MHGHDFTPLPLVAAGKLMGELLRRMLEQQLAALREGRDTAGVSFDTQAAAETFEAGNGLPHHQETTS